MSTPPEPAELRQLAQDTDRAEGERLIAVLLAISVDLSRAVRLLGKGR